MPLRQVRSLLAQRRVRAQPVVLEESHLHERVPGAHPLRKAVSVAGDAAKPVSQASVQALHPDRVGIERLLPETVPDRDLRDPATLAVLHQLRQPHAGCEHPAPLRPAADRIPVHRADQVPVDTQTVADPPDAATPRRTLARQRHHFGRGFLLGRLPAEGHHETAAAMLAHAPPAHAALLLASPLRCPTQGGTAHLRPLAWPFWSAVTAFPTNDQKASTSTSSNSRSFTSAAVSTSACTPATSSQSRIVSYLWPVISSAARRLPRRMTTAVRRRSHPGWFAARTSAGRSSFPNPFQHCPTSPPPPPRHSPLSPPALPPKAGHG